MWMHARDMAYVFCVRRMSEDHLPEKVLDVAWVMPDHVGVNVLPWQQYACGLLQHYSADSEHLMRQT
jgi:hypothetical protein